MINAIGAMLKRRSANARIRRFPIGASGKICNPGNAALLNGVSKSMKLLRWSVFCLVFIALLGASAVTIYRLRLRSSAEELVRASYGLLLQRRPPTVHDLRERFGRALRQPNPCTSDGCGYDVLLSNLALAEFHLVPYTYLRSSFWAKNGVVESNSLELWMITQRGTWTLPQGSWAGADVLIKYCDQCNSFMIYPSEGSPALQRKGSVEIGSMSTMVGKLDALAFNTDCLTSWRGCTNMADIMPNLRSATPRRRNTYREGDFEPRDRPAGR